MKAYRVLLNAQNIQTELDGKVGHYGFYATRFVLANNQKQAISTAIDLIRNEQNFKTIQLNSAEDSPRILIEEIEEIDQTQVPGSQIMGYTLYAEEDQTTQ